MHIQKKSLLTDYFHLKIVKLCLTLPSSVDFSKIGKNVLKELAQGVQIGYSAQRWKTYSYSSLCWNTGYPKVETYLIASETGSFEVAGVHLMADNPDLYLNGNIIAPIKVVI
jgi:hypothetical protein